MILTRDNLLIYRYRNETVHVEPWGANAVRVRATKNPAFPENDWALASRPSAQAESRGMCSIIWRERATTSMTATRVRGCFMGGILAVWNGNSIFPFEKDDGIRHDSPHGTSG